MKDYVENIYIKQGLLLASMLNNSEGWLDTRKNDLDKLEKPDKILIRKILGPHENPSAVFKYLELGLVTCQICHYEKETKLLNIHTE